MMSFIRAMFRYAKNRDLLPEWFILNRKSVCNSCEHKRKGLCREYCNLCKCTVSEWRNPLNKLAHPDEECPAGKWTIVQLRKGK